MKIYLAKVLVIIFTVQTATLADPIISTWSWINANPDTAYTITAPLMLAWVVSQWHWQVYRILMILSGGFNCFAVFRMQTWKGRLPGAGVAQVVQTGLLLLGWQTALQPMWRHNSECRLAKSHRRWPPLGSTAGGEPLLWDLPALHQIPQVCLLGFLYFCPFENQFQF